MSFNIYRNTIELGDTVIVYLSYDSMIQFTVERNKVHQTKYGAIKHDQLVGVQFGSKLQLTNGFVYILYPTPELWTVNLPHRTQILYSTDISLITLQLDLRPGSVVVESGTGSASLSHAILRTIAPDGHLHTFDFHAQRVETARAEFQGHGFGDLVTVTHRDVCKDGFDLEGIADAVFLDLPSPWDAVPFTKTALIPGGRICSFSPCIEQVQRACEAMHDHGFTDIRTMECLQRPIEVRTMTLPMPDLGFGPGRSYDPNSTASDPTNTSRENPVVGHVELTETNHKPPFKKFKPVPNDTEDSIRDGSTDVLNETVMTDSRGQKASYIFKASLPATMPGHTGYLTFATLYPS